MTHLPISKGTKNEVMRKLAPGIPIERILRDLHKDLSEGTAISRSLLISRKDVRNIERRSSTITKVRHADDRTAVHLLVEEWGKDPPSPCLAIKFQGTTSREFPDLAEDTFLMVMQTSHQETMFQQFASSIVCCDSTHCTNSYKFKLITLVGVDQYGCGRTAAWCISDKEDYNTTRAFFGAVASRSPDVNVRVLVTDGDLAGANAARDVFGPSPRHLLCAWHISKSVRTQVLFKVRENRELCKQIFSAFLVLQKEPSQEEFLL